MVAVLFDLSRVLEGLAAHAVHHKRTSLQAGFLCPDFGFLPFVSSALFAALVRI